jgi:hypothetical protein
MAKGQMRSNKELEFQCTLARASIQKRLVQVTAVTTQAVLRSGRDPVRLLPYME